MASPFTWKLPILDALHAAADAFGLERALVRAVCFIESTGNPKAVSPVGAQGLMQLMPATARELGVTAPLDPGQNAWGGAKYLAQLIRQFGGDVNKALCAYNWGPGNVSKKPAIPVEVQQYALNVLARMEVERRADPLADPPPAVLVSFFCPGCGSRFDVRSEGGSGHGIG